MKSKHRQFPIQRGMDLHRSVKERGPGLPVEKGRAKRILVVEADQIICLFLSKFLSMAGYEVATAGSWKQGLDLLQKDCYDLALCELTGPGMDGWAFAGHVKEESPSTKVGLITGWGRDEIAVKMQGSGVHFALFKPFGLDELQETVKKALEATPRQNRTHYRRHSHGVEFQNPRSPEQP